MAERDAFPLPMTFEEFDAEWLTAALRTRTPDVEVRKAEVLDVMHGHCTKIRLRLDVNEAGRRAGIPERVILKTGFEPHSREVYEVQEGEARGYRDVFPVLGLLTPATYFADFDPEQRQAAVIMEDLVLRGVSFCNPRVPESYQRVARRLSALAKFHAQTWDSPEFAVGQWSWLHPNIAGLREYFRPMLEPAVWKSYIDGPRGAAVSVRFHDLAWMNEALDRVVAFSESMPHCIIHGDTHLGNLYVDVDGAPGFFDSPPSRAPPMVEVAYHLTGALDTSDRRRWERGLIQHYLDELARCSVEPPDFDEAMRQYGIYLAPAYTVFMTNASVFQPEAINTAYAARFSVAMVDNDTIGLLKTI